MPERLCAHDQCHALRPPKGVSNLKYCVECHCKRKAEFARRRVTQDELFDEPRKFETLRITSAPDGYKMLVINDLQRPFHDVPSLNAVEQFAKDFVPDLEVYNGDISDFYLLSDFDKNPTRRFHFQDEVDDTRAWLESRCEANPNARRVFIEGNHEDRARRWLYRYGEELSSLRALTVPELIGWDEQKGDYLTYMSVLDFLGFRIQHGYKASMAHSKAFPVNVAHWMAKAEGSSGLCGHTHRFSIYAWTDARSSHSYIENGCLCRMDLEYAPFPNWQHAFCYGIVYTGQVHLHPVQIYQRGFVANGEFYPRVPRRRR